MMEILRAARALDLPDWMIGAGFVRNKVWDHLHGFDDAGTPNSGGSDIDLIYFDGSDLTWEKEIAYDERLKAIVDANWSAKNQARMHIKHDREDEYKNSEEALSEWIETPTCVAVRLENDDTLTLFVPHGIDDLVNLIVRPSPVYLNDLELFWSRVKGKHWQEKWPKLVVLEK